MRPAASRLAAKFLQIEPVVGPAPDAGLERGEGERGVVLTLEDVEHLINLVEHEMRCAFDAGLDVGVWYFRSSPLDL